ncbi:MAG: DUF892 family protein [Actinobacteria bacterium]|nr:MAG: DUF892 family protein [Actinomycetota bacterium]
MAEVSARNAKLIQYLTEAYGKERQLETALEAHIGLTNKASYRRRLQDHLKETKQHAREVERRIKALGGAVDGLNIPVPDRVSELASEVVLRGVTVAQKGMALAQGPIHALRGAEDRERMLRNARTEYAEEAREIATYRAIEALADVVGDRDTQQLARTILRDEQRMAAFLEKEIPRLTKSVAQAQIPAAQRNGGRRRRTRSSRSTGRRTTSRSRRTSGARSSGTARARA